ncbi:MAG TPA: winged helix-turn-helix domain-containing protein [Steroidobacteraceae bacterium]
MNAKTTPAVTPAVGCFRVSDLLIDCQSHKVTRNGVELAITGLSLELLLALVRAAPNLASFKTLMEQVWPDLVVNPETVTQRIKLLRQALGDSADNPRYILTVRGRGYRMVPQAVPLSVPPVTNSPVMNSDPDTSPTASAHTWTHSRLLTVTIVLLVVLAGGAWWGLDHARKDQPNRTRASTANPGGSIAVMPFSNLTGEPGKDYMGDGMAEELINSLAAVPGLRIPARASSFAYKGHDSDIRQVARDLGVATILEGSVRSAGERIRISVRLVDASSGFQIWTHTYDRQFADLFKLQDDLAAEIVQALSGYLGAPLANPGARTPPTRDVEAYRLFLQARAAGHGTPESEQAAEALVEEALARDPNFAPALALRAVMSAGAAALGYSVPPEELEVGERDAQQALALSPGLPDAHASLGLINAVRGNWIDAELHYRAALAGDPRELNNRGMYTLVLLRPVGRLQQANSILMESYSAAPADGFTVHELSLTNSLLGHDADALKFARLHKELGGGGQQMGNALVYARAAAHGGQFQEAAESAGAGLTESLSKAGAASAVKMFYSALADPTRKSAALQAIERLMPQLESSRVDGQVRGFFLQALTMLGARDSAYAFANRSIDQGLRAHMVGSRIYLSDLWLPDMRPFRLDPRFQTLVTRLKMVAYWKQYGPPDGCDLQDSRLVCH